MTCTSTSRWTVMTRALCVTLGIIGLHLGHAGVALAQSQAINGTIEGFVRGPGGDPMVGAEVTATNVGTGYERKVLTDARGSYNIPLLPLGAYVVQASKQGFATVSESNLELTAGQVLTIEIQLSSTSFAESTKVTANTSPVEVGRTVEIGRASCRERVL